MQRTVKNLQNNTFFKVPKEKKFQNLNSQGYTSVRDSISRGLETHQKKTERERKVICSKTILSYQTSHQNAEIFHQGSIHKIVYSCLLL